MKEKIFRAVAYLDEKMYIELKGLRHRYQFDSMSDFVRACLQCCLEHHDDPKCDLHLNRYKKKTSGA